MPVNTRWFKQRLADEDKTQDEVAKRIGIDPPMLSRSLRGQREFKPHELVALASELRVPVAEVLEQVAGGELPAAAAADPRSMPIPIVGTVELGTGAVTTKAPSKGSKSAPLPPGIPKNGAALRVEDGPLRGALLYYVPRDEVEASAVGRLAVVSRGGRYWVRIVDHGDERDEYSLKAWPSGADVRGSGSVQLFSANPVLWIRL